MKMGEGTSRTVSRKLPVSCGGQFFLVNGTHSVVLFGGGGSPKIEKRNLVNIILRIDFF